MSQTKDGFHKSDTDLRVERAQTKEKLPQELIDHGQVKEQYRARSASSGERVAERRAVLFNPGFWSSESGLLADPVELFEPINSSLNDMNW